MEWLVYKNRKQLQAQKANIFLSKGGGREKRGRNISILRISSCFVFRVTSTNSSTNTGPDGGIRQLKYTAGSLEDFLCLFSGE